VLWWISRAQLRKIAIDLTVFRWLRQLDGDAAAVLARARERRQAQCAAGGH
jgi:hypothetical protein